MLIMRAVWNSRSSSQVGLPGLQFLAQPVVLAQEQRADRDVADRRIPPLQPGGVEAGLALDVHPLLGQDPLERPAGDLGQRRVDRARLERPVGAPFVEAVQVLLAIDDLAVQPAALLRTQQPAGRLRQAVDLAQVDLVVRRVGAPVDRPGAQEAVREPLGEVAEQHARAIGLHRRALEQRRDRPELARRLIERTERRQGIDLVLRRRRQVPTREAAIGQSGPGRVVIDRPLHAPAPPAWAPPTTG